MTMAESEIAHPAIVLRDDWLIERKTLPGHEKDQLKHYDRVNAERRRLPMVKIDKDSAYARALESIKDAYHLRDSTPYGRQQDFEDSPSGWPQNPTYGK